MSNLLSTDRDEAFRQMLNGVVDTVLWSTQVITDDDEQPFYMGTDYAMPDDEKTQLRYTVAHHLRQWFEEHATLLLPFFEEFPEATWDEMGKHWWLTTQGHTGALWDGSSNVPAMDKLEESLMGLYQLLALYVDDDGVLRVDPYSPVPQTDTLDEFDHPQDDYRSNHV